MNAAILSAPAALVFNLIFVFPTLAQGHSRDPTAAFDARLAKLMDGPHDIVNAPYIATRARQTAFAKIRHASKAAPATDPDAATISSVVVQPGARIIGDVVIYTEARDITVATSGAKTR